jgi:hypothetical protein
MASNFLIDLPPEDDFQMEISGTGKGKILDLPDGSQRSLSPALHVTFTNLENGKTVSLNATGTFTTTVDGTTSVTVMNGHNLALDPSPPGNGEGVFYTTGHFTFAFGDVNDTNNDGDFEFVPISGHGQIVEVIESYLL